MKQLPNLYIISLCFLFLATMVACNKNDNEENEYSAAAEAEQLADFLDALIQNGYDIDTTALGVYYLMDEIGEGVDVQPGDSIGVTYTGYFINRRVFDSSFYRGDGVWRYVHAELNVIPGFEDAINQLRKGGIGTFIIPSSLAYGASGTYGIPPYTTLIFDMELVDIYTADPEI